jgi:hypothetical protein
METVVTATDLEQWDQSREQQATPIPPPHEHPDDYRSPGDLADDACGDVYLSAGRLG